MNRKNSKLIKKLREGKVVTTEDGQKIRAIPGKFRGDTLTTGDILFAGRNDPGLVYAFQGFEPYSHLIIAANSIEVAHFNPSECVGVEIVNA